MYLTTLISPSMTDKLTLKFSPLVEDTCCDHKRHAVNAQHYACALLSSKGRLCEKGGF